MPSKVLGDYELLDSHLMDLVPEDVRRNSIESLQAHKFNNPVAYYSILKWAAKNNNAPVFEGIYNYVFGEGPVAKSIWANPNKCKIWEPCVYNQAYKHLGKDLFWVILGAASAQIKHDANLELDPSSELGRLINKGVNPNNVLNISWDPVTAELNQDLGLGYVYPKSSGYWDAVKDCINNGQLKRLSKGKDLAFNADTQQMLTTFSGELALTIDLLLSKLDNRFILMVNVVKQYLNNGMTNNQLKSFASEIIKPFSKNVILLDEIKESDTTRATRMCYFFIKRKVA